MKSFISMVVCLSVLTATPVFSMNQQAEESLASLGMRSIRSDDDLERMKKDEKRILRRSIKKRKEKEDHLIFGVLPVKSAVSFVTCATFTAMVYIIFTTSWSGPGTKSS